MSKRTGVFIGQPGSQERQILGMVIERAYKRWRYTIPGKPYGPLLTKIQQEEDLVVLLEGDEARILIGTLVDALTGFYGILPTGLN